MTALYEWQRNLYDRWLINGKTGVLKAVPGAGKTKAASHLIRRVFEAKPEAKVLVLAPTRTIIRQWEEELTGLPVSVATYFWAAKNGGVYDLVVYDECHSLLSPVRAKALDIKTDARIGLSATPGESAAMLGGIIENIDWGEANISPFEVKYVVFDMSPRERETYACHTDNLKRVMANRGYDEDMKMIAIMKRRSFVYLLPKRVSVALKIVEKHPQDRIILFSERLDQCKELHARLWASGTPAALFTSETDTISSYIDRSVRVLVTSKMLKEGFNDPSTTLGILVSTPLSERNQVQTVGRIIRSFPSKIAEIFILLASETTDTKLLRTGIRGKTIPEETI